MDRIVGEKYRLIKKIGAGSFGQIYSGEEISTHEKVAIKLESIKTKIPQLSYESKLYIIFSGGANVPKMRWFGVDGEHNVLVMDLLGKSLEDLFVANQRPFSLKTVLMLADQMISAVEYMHNKNFLHRDIKPDNFCIGLGNLSNQIYILDFGLSKKFRDMITHVHINYTDGRSLTGTARYASINSLKGIEQSRRDDMESLAYVWIYLLKGCLPWMGLDGKDRKQKYDRICSVKQKTSLETLCEGLPEEFITYLSSVKSLRFAETPNYLGYKKMFRKLFIRLGYEYDYKYDWLTPHKPPRPISKTPQTLEHKVRKQDDDDDFLLKPRQRMQREQSRDALPRPKLQKHPSVPQVRLTHIISTSSSSDDEAEAAPKPKKKTPTQTIQFQAQRASPRRTPPSTSTKRFSAALTSSPSSSRAAALPKWMMERPSSSYRSRK